MSINIGDTAINHEHQWIKVMNPNGIGNGNGFHAFGKTASIAEGGMLTVYAVDGSDVLVSYTNQSGQGFGAAAGNGTLLLLPAHDFLQMSNLYHEKQKRENKLKEHVLSLLTS